MFPLDNFDDINTRLDRIHNDLLEIKLCIVTDKMYELGAISKDSYAQILDKEYEIITEQVTDFKKK